MSIWDDAPIHSAADDVLNRTKHAESFAKQLLSIEAPNGFVVGVLGPWGTGKTSFVNLARPHLEEVGITILDFNPWMFSGMEELVQSFFNEISRQLRGSGESNLEKLGKDLKIYGEVLSGLSIIPLIGPQIAPAGVAMSRLAELLQRDKEGISGQKKKVEEDLTNLDKLVIVVIDDIDRLTPSEIRSIFKLVRLTANFPNIIYVVSFDRNIVEKALEKQNPLSGRDYLEKILQLAIDLPETSERVLTDQLLREIENVLTQTKTAYIFNGDYIADYPL